MKKIYNDLIDNSDITENVAPKEELVSWLELMILNSICNVAMLTQRPKSIKLQMMHDAYDFVGIQTEGTPEEYVKYIANNTESGEFYKAMFLSGSTLGTFWKIIMTMGEQTNRIDEAISTSIR